MPAKRRAVRPGLVGPELAQSRLDPAGARKKSGRKSAAAPRRVAIANRHPRLRLDRRAVARAIHLLDIEFPKSKIPRALSTPDGENPKSKIPSGELSLVFLTDAALAHLHDQFLDNPAPTDVITFPGAPALGSAGEICVSADAALRQVSEFVVPALAGRKRRPPKGGTTNAQPSHSAPSSQRSALSSFSAELTLYLVHGWLHLAGHDDLVPAKKRAMRRAEARALRILSRANAVPKFTLRGTAPL